MTGKESGKHSLSAEWCEVFERVAYHVPDNEDKLTIEVETPFPVFVREAKARWKVMVNNYKVLSCIGRISEDTNGVELYTFDLPVKATGKFKHYVAVVRSYPGSWPERWIAFRNDPRVVVRLKHTPLGFSNLKSFSNPIVPRPHKTLSLSNGSNLPLSVKYSNEGPLKKEWYAIFDAYLAGNVLSKFTVKNPNPIFHFKNRSKGILICKLPVRIKSSRKSFLCSCIGTEDEKPKFEISLRGDTVQLFTEIIRYIDGCKGENWNEKWQEFISSTKQLNRTKANPKSPKIHILDGFSHDLTDARGVAKCCNGIAVTNSNSIVLYSKDLTFDKETLYPGYCITSCFQLQSFMVVGNQLKKSVDMYDFFEDTRLSTVEFPTAPTAIIGSMSNETVTLFVSHGSTVSKVLLSAQGNILKRYSLFSIHGTELADMVLVEQDIFVLDKKSGCIWCHNTNIGTSPVKPDIGDFDFQSPGGFCVEDILPNSICLIVADSGNNCLVKLKIDRNTFVATCDNISLQDRSPCKVAFIGGRIYYTSVFNPIVTVPSKPSSTSTKDCPIDLFFDGLRNYGDQLTSEESLKILGNDLQSWKNV